MQSESKVDPKIIEEILKFSKNVNEAPKLVSAPDEISLEVTPHDVVQQMDKTRLLHYKPITEKQHKTPLLISYALINRFHILDIQPEKSWVRNLLEQGFDIYMLDWGTPTSMDKYLDFDDYVNGYLDSYVEYIKNESSTEKISLQGYCTGATIATTYAALHPESVKNYIATAPVIDGWRDTTVISNLAKHMDVDKMVETIGNMPPEFMYYAFSVLKPFEQGIELCLYRWNRTCIWLLWIRQSAFSTSKKSNSNVLGNKPSQTIGPVMCGLSISLATIHSGTCRRIVI